MKQKSILNLIYIYNFDLYGKGDIEGKIPWTYSRELTKHAKNPPLTRLHADNMLHLTKSSRLGPSFVIMNNSGIFFANVRESRASNGGRSLPEGTDALVFYLQRRRSTFVTNVYE